MGFSVSRAGRVVQQILQALNPGDEAQEGKEAKVDGPRQREPPVQIAITSEFEQMQHGLDYQRDLINMAIERIRANTPLFRL